MTSERAVEPGYPEGTVVRVEDMGPVERAYAEAMHEDCEDGPPHPLTAHSPWSGADLDGTEPWPAFMDRLARHGLRLAAARGEPDEEPHGAALIPAGEPCPICGPKGHGGHEDDSYGACVLCREYVPHTDDLTVLVAWPCAPARLAAARGEPEIDVERLARAVERVAFRRHPAMTGHGAITWSVPGATSADLPLAEIAVEYDRLGAE